MKSVTNDQLIMNILLRTPRFGDKITPEQIQHKIKKMNGGKKLKQQSMFWMSLSPEMMTKFNLSNLDLKVSYFIARTASSFGFNQIHK